MSRQLRVLVISGSWPPIHCGVGDFTQKLVHELKVQGVDIQVLTSIEAKSENTVHAIMPEWRSKYFNLIIRDIEKLQPDIIHYQYPSVMYQRNIFPNLLPRMLKQKFPKIPILLTLHEYHDASRLGRTRTRLTLNGITGIVYTNQSDEDDLNKKTKSITASVIPIGSNIMVQPTDSKQTPSTLRQFSLKSHQYWLNIGFVDSSKGVENLLMAFAKLSSPQKLVIGTEYNAADRYHQHISALAEKYKLDFLWTGYLDSSAMSELLTFSKAVILPFDSAATERRGSVVAALEHGKAMITTGDITTSPFASSAYLISNNSPLMIAKAVEELSSDPNHISQLEKSAQQAAKKYSWGSIASQYIKLYETLVKV